MTALASSTESVMVVRVAVIVCAVARTPIVRSLLHATFFVSGCSHSIDWTGAYTGNSTQHLPVLCPAATIPHEI